MRITGLDGVRKSTGEARYAGDIVLPGMLYAKILRPPVHGARLKHIDVSGVKNDPEIRLVQESDLVAVLHPHPDVAEKALSLLKAEFDLPESSLDNKTIFAHLLKSAPKEGEVISEGGDLTQGERLATKVFDETYFDHYVAHAAIETHTATVKNRERQGNGLAVYPEALCDERRRSPRPRAFPPKVRVIMPFVGGGFGGKSNTQQSIEAARLAKITGRPVQVMWSRKEEFFYDTFRPAAVVKIRSGFTGDGRITFWKHDTYFTGPRGLEQFYAFPHHRSASYGHHSGTDRRPPLCHRAIACSRQQHQYLRQRISNGYYGGEGRHLTRWNSAPRTLRTQRMLATLKAAATKFGWKSAPGPEWEGLWRSLLYRCRRMRGGYG